jgi:toxin-antitoxin system PIN domain toxin
VKPALLDLNVLIALAWPNHVHHRAAHAWFSRNARRGWATCPATQAGFVRLSSNPAVVRAAVPPREAVELLARLTALPHHRFWDDDVRIPELCERLQPLLTGHRQVGDLHLLGIALRHKGVLATLDGGLFDLLPSSSPWRASVEAIPAG